CLPCARLEILRAWNRPWNRLEGLPRRDEPLMPDTPDFDQIARQIAVTLSEGRPIDGIEELTEFLDVAQRLRVAVVEQLRQVWNARGAADLAALETAHQNDNWTELEDAIK